jgi:hypothetical protein
MSTIIELICAPFFLDDHGIHRVLSVVDGDDRRLKPAALCQYAFDHPLILSFGTGAELSRCRDLTFSAALAASRNRASPSLGVRTRTVTSSASTSD